MGMGMGAGRGHGGPGFGLMRSFRRDQSVVHQQLAPGILRRIGRFARPYRRMLIVFLVLIVVRRRDRGGQSAHLPAIIDTASTTTGSGSSKAWPCWSGCWLWPTPASPWPTLGVGPHRRGSHFRHAGQGVRHIQKMPLAFFTRTQTGSLVSRLNNDVLGAQQAFTDTFNSW